jgi:VanZ family protein
MMKKKKRWVIMLILWMTIIFVATQLPYFKGENTEAVIHHSNFFANYLDAKVLNLIIRKLTHLTVFAILAVLFFKSIRRVRFRYLLTWLFTSLYALSDEWHQSFVPGRESSYKDVLLDSFGALLILSFIYFLKKRKKPVR